LLVVKRTACSAKVFAKASVSRSKKVSCRNASSVGKCCSLKRQGGKGSTKRSFFSFGEGGSLQSGILCEAQFQL
jgi:hypothetical protein